MIEEPEVPMLRRWKLDEFNDDSNAELVDFDGTMTTGGYPHIGDPYESTLRFIKSFRSNMGKLAVIWTCRTSMYLCKTPMNQHQAIREMEQWLHEHGVEVDGLLMHDKPICNMYLGDETLNPADLKSVEYGKEDDHGLVVPEV